MPDSSALEELRRFLQPLPDTDPSQVTRLETVLGWNFDAAGIPATAISRLLTAAAKVGTSVDNLLGRSKLSPGDIISTLEAAAKVARVKARMMKLAVA